MQGEPGARADSSPGHFGILGMRERMEQIGGSLDISSRPGGGAMARVDLPAALLPAVAEP